jgi:hypothetical protein
LTRILVSWHQECEIGPPCGQRWEVCIKRSTIQPQADGELTTASTNACF